jgi:hypothetical protein
MSEGAEVAAKKNVNSEVRYRLDLEGVQNVRRSRGGSEEECE